MFIIIFIQSKCTLNIGIFHIWIILFWCSLAHFNYVHFHPKTPPTNERRSDDISTVSNHNLLSWVAQTIPSTRNHSDIDSMIIIYIHNYKFCLS